MRYILFSLMALFIAVATKGQTGLSKLPIEAQVFVKKHFSQTTVSHVKQESDLSYEAVLANGDVVEFDKNGVWEDVKCKSGKVPSVIIPVQITAKIASKFPSAHIVEIERDKKEYKVKLSNDVEVEFDRKFNIRDLDR